MYTLLTAPLRNLLSCLLPSALFGLFLILTGCAGLPKTPEPTLPVPKHATPPPEVSRIIRYALSLQGVPYRYGGSSPATGFDCSGFVYHVYARQGIRLPRESRDMAAALAPLAPRQRRSGDLVFFHTTRPYSHVGIYLGQEQFIHAPSRRSSRVMISDLRTPYWARRLAGFRRPFGFYNTITSDSEP